jgi:hypothetical protein
MTPQEIQWFNEKVPQYRQVEALKVTWANQEPVELSLTLRPADPAIPHTRMVIRAKGVRGLRLYPDRVDIPEVGCLQIRSIADRHWEDANYEVVDIEQMDAMTFTCVHIESERLVY